MARIPDEVIERLKREVAVVRLVETAGVTPPDVTQWIRRCQPWEVPAALVDALHLVDVGDGVAVGRRSDRIGRAHDVTFGAPGMGLLAGRPSSGYGSGERASLAERDWTS